MILSSFNWIWEALVGNLEYTIEGVTEINISGYFALFPPGQECALIVAKSYDLSQPELSQTERRNECRNFTGRSQFVAYKTSPYTT